MLNKGLGTYKTFFCGIENLKCFGVIFTLLGFKDALTNALAFTWSIEIGTIMQYVWHT